MKMSKNIQFRPRKGAHLSKQEAQVVGERLTELTYQKGGEIQPLDVVADAQPAHSPLHKFFDWEDSVAGRKWREQQARVLVGSVVEVVVSKGQSKETRSFFNVTNKEGTPVYVTLETTLGNKEYINELISEAKTHMEHLYDVLDLLMRENRKK